MVGALERPAVAAPDADHVRPVPADVDEGAQLQLLVAKDEDRDREAVPVDRRREVVADVAHLGHDADDLPGGPEDELVLELGDAGVGVEGRRQGGALGEDPVDLVGVDPASRGRAGSLRGLKLIITAPVSQKERAGAGRPGTRSSQATGDINCSRQSTTSADKARKTPARSETAPPPPEAIAFQSCSTSTGPSGRTASWRCSGDVVAEPLDDAMESEIVAVPTRGVERWLTQELSGRLGVTPGRHDGVCANIDFPFPGSVVGAALALAGGVDPRADPWSPARAVWPLLQVVDDAIERAVARPARRPPAQLGAGRRDRVASRASATSPTSTTATASTAPPCSVHG